MKKRFLSLLLAMVMITIISPFSFATELSHIVVVQPKYYSVEPFNEGLAAVQLNGKWGFIDKMGKEVIPLKYESVNAFSEGLAMVSLNGKWGFIDKTGKVVAPIKYSNGSSFSEGLAPVELNYQSGFIDKTGRIAVPLKYDNANGFFEGLAVVWKANNKVLIDKTGKEVVSLKYYDVWDFTEGLAKVELDNKVGFINKTGKEVIPLKYELAGSFSAGLAEVRLNNKWGFIDKTGKEVVQLKYDYVYPFSEDLSGVVLNNKYGFIDKTGKEVIPLKYDQFYDWMTGSNSGDVGYYSEGLAAVKLGGKFGFIDKTGKEVVKFKYQYAKPFSEGLAAVGNKYHGFIDNTGKEVVPLIYDDVQDFSEGLAAFKYNGKWGFIAIDPTSPVITNPGAQDNSFMYDGYYKEEELDTINLTTEYSNVEPFSNGLARVKKNAGYGFINEKGFEVIPPKYLTAVSFSDGLAWVTGFRKYNFIDSRGSEAISFDHTLNYIYRFSEGLAVVELNDKETVVIDKAGKEVFKIEEGFVDDFSEGLSRFYYGTKTSDGFVINNKKWGFLDKTGKPVIAPLYSYAYKFSEGLAGVSNKVDGGELSGFINNTGKIVIPLKYREVNDFVDGLAKVKKVDGVEAFIDKTGREVISLEYYDSVRNFSEGLALVAKNIDYSDSTGEFGGLDKYGFIDKTGKLIIPMIYDYAKDFSDGLALVKKDGKYGYIDKTGVVVIPLIYDDAQVFSEGLTWVKKDNKQMIIRKPLLPELADPLYTASKWARDAISSAIEKGYVPKDLQSNYKNGITRAEFCRMTVKYIEYVTGKNIDTVLVEKGLTRNPNAFTDTDDPDILAAFALGVTSGTGNGTFTPKGQFNREQAATMLANACRVLGRDMNNTPVSGFVDMDSASGWAANSINYCYANGIMVGANNKFNPKDTYTREQSIITFNNIK